jgi:hypothetical protein
MLGLGNVLTTGSNKEQLYSLLLDGVNDWLDIGDNWDPGTGDFSIFLLKPLLVQPVLSTIQVEQN